MDVPRMNAATDRGVIRVNHLIDACGYDVEKLAGLALLLASASFGFGIMAKTDSNTLAQVDIFQRAALEIGKRIAISLEPRPRSPDVDPAVQARKDAYR
jgi:hypothetical protein